MKIYYETTHRDPGSEYPTATAHDTLEDAINFADAHGIKYIQQIGGAWDDFEKCEFCGEWFTAPEIENGLCERCIEAIKSHGG